MPIHGPPFSPSRSSAGWPRIRSPSDFTALCHYLAGHFTGPGSDFRVAGDCPARRVAARSARSLTIFLLGAGVACWVAGFDILYALQDEAIDRAEKLHSIPAALGRGKALAVSRCCHFLTALFFLAVGITGHFHMLYWIGFSAAAFLLLIEQSLVSAKDISKINLAFMTANGLIGLVFGGVGNCGYAFSLTVNSSTVAPPPHR